MSEVLPVVVTVVVIAVMVRAEMYRHRALVAEGRCEVCARTDKPICRECARCLDPTCNGGCIYCRQDVPFGRKLKNGVR